MLDLIRIYHMISCQKVFKILSTLIDYIYIYIQIQVYIYTKFQICPAPVYELVQVAGLVSAPCGLVHVPCLIPI
jgi:hypothetical protein